MDGYTSEHEQVEALKKWWKENGTAVILGLTLGLGGLFGYQYWQSSRRAEAEQASLGFQQMMSQLMEEDAQAAEQTARKLVAEHGDSGYAALAALTLAKLALDGDDADAAAAQLQWVLQNTSEPALLEIARLRLARLRLGAGDAEAALSLIEQGTGKDSPRRAAYHELRGDALAALGRTGDARAAYRQALRLTEASQGDTTLLELKIDDLGMPEAGARS